MEGEPHCLDNPVALEEIKTEIDSVLILLMLGNSVGQKSRWLLIFCCWPHRSRIQAPAELWSLLEAVMHPLLGSGWWLDSDPGDIVLGSPFPHSLLTGGHFFAFRRFLYYSLSHGHLPPQSQSQVPPELWVSDHLVWLSWRKFSAFQGFCDLTGLA